MLGLGRLTWIIGPTIAAVFGSILFKNLQEMLWESAPEVVQLIGFRRRGYGNRDDTAGR